MGEMERVGFLENMRNGENGENGKNGKTWEDLGEKECILFTYYLLLNQRWVE